MISQGGFKVLEDLDEDFPIEAQVSKGWGNSNTINHDVVVSGKEDRVIDFYDDFRIVERRPTVKKIPKKPLLCRHFIRGHCLRGSACQYAHSMNQLQACQNSIKENSIQASNHPLYRTTYCRFFQEGCCHAGSACNFAHSPSELRKRPSTEEYKEWCLTNDPAHPLAHHDSENINETPAVLDTTSQAPDAHHQLELCESLVKKGCIQPYQKSMQSQPITRVDDIYGAQYAVTRPPEVSSFFKKELQGFHDPSHGGDSILPMKTNFSEIRQKLLVTIEKSALAEDFEKLSAGLQEIIPPLTEKELANLLWRSAVVACKTISVQLLSTKWRDGDWTRLTVDAGLEGKKCLIHEMVIKAVSDKSSIDNAKGIISLILRKRPAAVLDLYQGSTPLMLAVKMRASMDIIVLLVPESVPQNLKIKSGAPPRTAIETAEHLSKAVGISNEAKKHYCEIYSVLKAIGS